MRCMSQGVHAEATVGLGDGTGGIERVLVVR